MTHRNKSRHDLEEYIETLENKIEVYQENNMERIMYYRNNELKSFVELKALANLEIDRVNSNCNTWEGAFNIVNMEIRRLVKNKQ